MPTFGGTPICFPCLAGVYLCWYTYLLPLPGVTLPQLASFLALDISKPKACSLSSRDRFARLRSFAARQAPDALSEGLQDIVKDERASPVNVYGTSVNSYNVAISQRANFLAKLAELHGPKISVANGFDESNPSIDSSLVVIWVLCQKYHPSARNRSRKSYDLILQHGNTRSRPGIHHRQLLYLHHFRRYVLVPVYDRPHLCGTVL